MNVETRRPSRARFGSVRDVTLDLFRQLGINTIFGNPGSTELPMFRDFPDDFRYVLGLQEAVVVGMADGYAQGTGNASLVNLHSAGGVGHALGNIFTAYKNKTPMIITAGQQARSILPFDPFLSATQATEFPKPYIKYAIEPARAEDVPRAFERAYHMAMQPPFGPTFVSIPVDDWDKSAEYIDVHTVRAVRYPDPSAITAVSEALAKASRPALVLGAAVDRDHGWDAVIALAERYDARVFAAPASDRCCFPQDHPLHAGFLPAWRDQIVRMLDGHDVIVVLGGGAFLYHVEADGPHIPPGSTLFHITEDPDMAAWAPIGTSIVANLRPALEALVSQAPAPTRVYERNRPLPDPVAMEDKITNDLLMQILAKTRSEDSILYEESPTSTAARQQQVRLTRPQSYYSCASGSLGHSLPGSVGLALARKGEKVIAVLGDGSSMYSPQGLYAAAQLELPVTFIIVNNRAYKALDGFASHFQMTKPVGTALPGIDFVKLGEAMGCRAARVTDPRKLEEAMREAIGAKQPYVLEVVTV